MPGILFSTNMLSALIPWGIIIIRRDLLKNKGIVSLDDNFFFSLNNH